MRKLSRLLGFQDRALHAASTAKPKATAKSLRKGQRAAEKVGGKSGMRAAHTGLASGTRNASDCAPLMNITLQDLQLEVPAPLDSGIYVATSHVAVPRISDDVQPGLVVHTEVPPAIELDPVTLVVYEWHNVQPGVLAWVFPSLNAAVSAARTMKNAVKWAILRGQRSVKATVDVEAERARGVVLLEAV